jgi:DNA-directed RNA polymerase specialized sigma subunit
MNDRGRGLSARRYLGQLQELDEKINQNVERLEEMKLQATCTGAICYNERVQSSMKGDKLCNDVTRYVAFNDEINAEIDSFVDAKNKIIGQIRGLHNVNYMQVLFKVYVQFKSLKIAASEMGKSYSYVVELHRKALKEFEKTYKNLSYLT